MLSQAAFMWEHLQGKTCYIVLLRQETDKEEEGNSLKASAISFDKIFQVLKRFKGLDYGQDFRCT